MRAISSRQNPIVGRYRAAAHGEDPDALLLDGPHLVGDALAAGLRIHHAVIAADALERSDVATIVRQLGHAGAEVVTFTGPVMAAVSPVRSPSVVVALAARPAASRNLFDGPDRLVVIAADVQDPGNVGAIVRVAEAAGAAGVVLAGACADPFGWKALRGSMGSALRLPTVTTPSLLDAVATARRHGAAIVATVPRGGTSLFDASLAGPLALLIGGEGSGLPPTVTDAADLRVTIPMEPPVESLNAAVAAAVMLFEAKRQRARSIHGLPLSDR